MAGTRDHALRDVHAVGLVEYAGRDYSHRKQWIIDQLQFLSSVFANRRLTWM
jgi:hypothetical protein